jgi:hypothetical protein
MISISNPPSDNNQTNYLQEYVIKKPSFTCTNPRTGERLLTPDSNPRPIGQPSVLTHGPQAPNRSTRTPSPSHQDEHSYTYGYPRRSHHEMRSGHHYYDGRPGGGSYFDSYYLDPFIYSDSYIYNDPYYNFDDYVKPRKVYTRPPKHIKIPVTNKEFSNENKVNETQPVNYYNYAGVYYFMHC